MMKMSYEPNDFSNYTNLNKMDGPEIINSYLKINKLNNSKNNFNNSLKNNSFNDLYSSISTNESNLINCFNKPKFLRDNKTNITDKFKNFTNKLKDEEKEARLNRYNKNRMKNVDVLNIRYRDTNSNFYFLSTLPKFKHVTNYNNKARNYYNMDISPNKGIWSIGTSEKVYLYRNNFDNKFNF